MKNLKDMELTLDELGQVSGGTCENFDVSYLNQQEAATWRTLTGNVMNLEKSVSANCSAQADLDAANKALSSFVDQMAVKYDM